MNIIQLIEEARNGHHASQKYLFDIYAERLLYVCELYVKNPEDAEERLLDGFRKFFDSLATFEYKSEAALYGFLKLTMINECLAFLRDRRSFTLVDEIEADDIPVPTEEVYSMSAENTMKLLQLLPVGYRTIFNLYVLEDMSHDEIAAELGITANNSAVMYWKAKRFITKKLTGKGGKYENRK